MNCVLTKTEISPTLISEETKNKISLQRRGQGNGMFGKIPWNKGKKLSEEIKKKMSESTKG